MGDDSIKVLAFDVDGTLVTPSVWAHMHQAYGLPEAMEEDWRRQYHEKEISYVQWMENISAFYRTRPLTRKETEVIHRSFEFQPHVEETLRLFRDRYELALISSSQEDYVKAVAERLGITRVHAFSYDEFDSNDKFYAIRFRSTEGEGLAKVDAVKILEMEVGCMASEICFVGDSRNDLEAFEYTGRGVLIGEGNEDMRKAAWKQIYSLDELLTFL